MTIDTRHVSASLRLKDLSREHVMSLHRIRPNINGQQVTSITDAVRQIRGSQLGGATMTVTTELFEA